MLPYAILMFAISIIFVALSITIYRGRTDLIHSYHQTKVKDKAAYGKAFGKASFSFAITPLISGIIGLFGDSNVFAVAAVLVLVVGIIFGFCCILSVQRKYNNGLF